MTSFLLILGTLINWVLKVLCLRLKLCQTRVYSQSVISHLDMSNSRYPFQPETTCFLNYLERSLLYLENLFSSVHSQFSIRASVLWKIVLDTFIHTFICSIMCALFWVLFWPLHHCLQPETTQNVALLFLLIFSLYRINNYCSFINSEHVH